MTQNLKYGLFGNDPVWYNKHENCVPWADLERNGCKMFRYIGIEDLVASALIEQYRHKMDGRKVSLRMLANYGAAVVKILTKSGQNAILLLTKDSTYEFVHDYAEFFSIVKCDGEEYIELKETVTTDELRRQFRKNLTVDLAKALTKAESLAALDIY